MLPLSGSCLARAVWLPASYVVPLHGHNKKLIPAAKAGSMLAASPPKEGVGRRRPDGAGMRSCNGEGVTPRCRRSAQVVPACRVVRIVGHIGQMHEGPGRERSKR